MLIFPDRESTRNLPKNCFRLEICLQHGGNFEVLKIKGCTVVVGCYYNLLSFVANFELGDLPIME